MAYSALVLLVGNACLHFSTTSNVIGALGVLLGAGALAAHASFSEKRP